MNSSSCNSSFQRDLLPPIYGVETCVALAGNILALWLLVNKERKNWNMGVVFSCNLIISDIFYALSLPLFIVYYSKGLKWDFGEAVCRIERFLFTCNLYVSIYFIMCISVTRYMAIVHPFFTLDHICLKHAKIISVFIWISVASVSSPVLYYSGIKNERCSLFTDPNQKSKKVIFRVILAVMGCLVPCVVTFASYFSVIWVVFKNANITSLEKKKVSLIVGFVCALCTVSFVPYHIMQIWYFKAKEENKTNYYVCNGYPASKALACLNMCLHPILHMAVFDRITCFRRSPNEFL
ncbi:P2Y purinoceptor 11-like [Hemibagrus wyckioides]|uniref:P2Y purinoceptor 11-like n=1 Tax=Hemibagrus wyckioides TaxID=337641 RepID=UPI00266D7B96|nr:P2Y purinoceptor 11-like [Hemibagrus wyckioides]